MQNYQMREQMRENKLMQNQQMREQMREIVYELEEDWKSKGIKEHVQQVRNNEQLIYELLEVMGFQNYNTRINAVAFSDFIKCIPVKNMRSSYGFRQLPIGVPRAEDGQLFNPNDLLNMGESVVENPDDLTDESNEVNKGSSVLILGEYYPANKTIVLYYKAIIYHLAPIVLDNTQSRQHMISHNFYEDWLQTGLSAVYSHEFFHAVHHQNGDLNNADVFSIESLAEYFELQYCNICPYVPAATTRKYASELRDSLKRRPDDFVYRGALALDKLLGWDLPGILRSMARNNVPFYTTNGQHSVKEIIAPRYVLFRDLFDTSGFKGNKFWDIYCDMLPFLK